MPFSPIPGRAATPPTAPTMLSYAVAVTAVGSASLKRLLIVATSLALRAAGV